MREQTARVQHRGVKRERERERECGLRHACACMGIPAAYLTAWRGRGPPNQHEAGLRVADDLEGDRARLADQAKEQRLTARARKHVASTIQRVR